jgi:hypothetical protein
MLRSLLIIGKIDFQVVRKEKDFEYPEDDKQLYQDNDPEGPAKLHVAKTVSIKCNYAVQEFSYGYQAYFQEKQAGAHIEGERVKFSSIFNTYDFVRHDVLPNGS